MAFRNSIMVGYESGSQLEVISGDPNDYDISGTQRHWLSVSTVFGSGFAYPEFDGSTGQVIVTQVPSGFIRSYDFNSTPNLLTPGPIVSFSSRTVNCAVDHTGTIYYVDLLGDIAKSSPGGFPQKFIINPTRGQFTTALRLNGEGELGVLGSQGSYGSVVSASIERYDANTGAYLGPLIDRATTNTPKGLATPFYFDFDPAGNVYVVEIESLSPLKLAVLKFDPSGAALGPFSNPSHFSDPKCIRVSPDGQRLYVLDGDTILEFDMNGNLLKSVALSFDGSKSFSFIKEKIAPAKPQQKGPSVTPIIEFILNGVTNDSSGVVILPGHGPHPIGPWQGRELEIWNNLPSQDRDLMTAFATTIVLRMFSNPKASRDIEDALLKTLSAETRQSLKRMLG